MSKITDKFNIYQISGPKSFSNPYGLMFLDVEYSFSGKEGYKPLRRPDHSYLSGGYVPFAIVCPEQGLGGYAVIHKNYDLTSLDLGFYPLAEPGEKGYMSPRQLRNLEKELSECLFVKGGEPQIKEKVAEKPAPVPTPPVETNSWKPKGNRKNYEPHRDGYEDRPSRTFREPRRPSAGYAGNKKKNG